MKNLIPFIIAMSLSTNTYASDFMKYASDIQSKDTMDNKCRAFFRHYMKLANDGKYSGMEALMAALDIKSPGLVDYCDARRSKYIK